MLSEISVYFVLIVITCVLQQKRNALFIAVDLMNLPIISYLFERNINVNQMGKIMLTRSILWYSPTSSQYRRKSHIIDYAIYLYLNEHDDSERLKRMGVVRHLLKQNNVNITNYVRNNSEKVSFEMRRNPLIIATRTYTIKDALIEMGIDPYTLKDKHDNRTSICCFQ